MTPGTCIHFNGLRGDDSRCCKAGVNYADAFGKEPGVFLRFPCIQFDTRPANGKGTYVRHGQATVRIERDRRGATMIPCAQYREPTAAEVEAYQIDTDAQLNRTYAAIRVASAWRVKPKPAQDRSEVIECPICKGKLHLSQSAYNGHVHGQCETEGCVSWME